MKIRIVLYISLIIPSFLYAADENDTRLRLEQKLLQQNFEEQKPLLEQQKSDQMPSMVIDGEVIKVENNLADLGHALYLAVMQKQWAAADIYLGNYLKLEGYDESLAKFAQGALARVKRQFSEAEQYFNDALSLQPQNTMIKLELARLLTEQYKNKEATELFNEVKTQLAGSHDPVVNNIDKTVDVYIQGLNQRDSWQGSVSLGARYSSNINNTSEKSTTWIEYGRDADGNKIPIKQIKRNTPDAISANALDYEFALNKRWSLQENHGFAIKAFGFGRAYDDYKNFNEMTLSVNAGYSFQNRQKQILIAPVFEHRRFENNSFSNAWGGRAEIMNFIGNDKALKLEAEVKDIDNVLYPTQSGLESSAFLTFWKILPYNLTLFGGLDYVDHNSEEKYFTAYQQEGVRFGLSKQFSEGVNTTLYSSMRWRQYDKYNAVLNDKRDDFEQNYTFVVSVPKWKFYGLTPNFTYQYNKNKSNIDWLYSYDKHNLSVKLERRF